MYDRTIQLQLGIGSVVVSAFLMLVAIPSWVSSPSNVPKIILSPLFWPLILSGLTGIVGLGMILTSFWQPKTVEPEVSDVEDRWSAWGRLASIALIMGLAMLALPRIGMVWTAMLVFAATAYLIRTSHPKTALASAVLVPLALYAFFAHVAGVAIPQGDLVRLP